MKYTLGLTGPSHPTEFVDIDSKPAPMPGLIKENKRKMSIRAII